MDGPALPFAALVSWTGWTGLFLVAVWWIRGAPERRRADTAAEVDRKRLAMEGEVVLQKSYGDHIDRLTKRIEAMEANSQRLSNEHDQDRAQWTAERASLRSEYEADRKRWTSELAQERKLRDAEREQWRRERLQLLDQVDGLERKLRSYGSSVGHLEQSGVNAPTTTARLKLVPEEVDKP